MAPMDKVRKAVIPAAGLGTRFLPATKSVPKEMLPLVDRPTLLYVVEEAVSAGIEDIIIIAGRGKTAIENFFDTSYEVEDLLEKQGKIETLEKLKNISNMANIISVRQKEAKGLGHAVHCAKPVVGNESFCVLLGDEITFPIEGFDFVSKELISLFNDTQISCVNVMAVPEDQAYKYGIIAHGEASQNYKDLPVLPVTNVIEKPNLDEAPSNLALPGRYVFTAEIFEKIRDGQPGKNGEIQLTDAMTEIAKSQGLNAINIPNRRFDAGDKLGFLQANIELALENEELATPLREYLKNLKL